MASKLKSIFAEAIDAIFDSGLKAYDKTIVYTTLEAFEKLLKRKKGIYDGVHIFSEVPLQVIKEIEKFLPDTTQMYLMTAATLYRPHYL